MINLNLDTLNPALNIGKLSVQGGQLSGQGVDSLLEACGVPVAGLVAGGQLGDGVGELGDLGGEGLAVASGLV